MFEKEKKLNGEPNRSARFAWAIVGILLTMTAMLAGSFG